MQGLPKDLDEAKKMLFLSSKNSLQSSSNKRWEVNLKFEGLKISSLINTLSKELVNSNYNHILSYPDMGATALSKRDYPEMKDLTYTFKELSKALPNEKLPKILIAVNPQPFDYEEFEELVTNFEGTVLMVNGRLEDTIVGVGSVARERRKRFTNSWKNSFWLEPLKDGALMHAYPDEWSLFKNTQLGYKFISSFSSKPNSEEVFESLIDSP